MTHERWHQLSTEETLQIFKTSPGEGLSVAEARRRLGEVGPNQLQEIKGTPPLAMLARQFTDFMVLVLLAAAVVSFFLGEMVDALAIMAIVVLNGVLGFFQEFRAERSLEALKRLSAPEARVVRGGEHLRVPAKEVVPGDIAFLEAGDMVPADIRLVTATEMEAEESSLTGESLPVRKDTGKLKENMALGDRTNMAFQGTLITRGRGMGVVVATGMHTEMGQVANLIQEVEGGATPLQQRLEGLGRWLVIGCLLICSLVVVVGILSGQEVYRMFLAGISLAVAVIPEGLPAVVTISLAIGVQRMLKRHAIVRRLPAVETLGCATIICSDKTGTLTQNEMTVRRIVCGDKDYDVSGSGYEPKGEFLLNGKGINLSKDGGLGLLLRASVLCNNAVLESKRQWRMKKRQTWSINGDPTEGALLVMAGKGGISRENIEKEETRVREIPFDSERKYMSVVCESRGSRRLYLKGAPDVVLRLCKSVIRDRQVVPLGEAERKSLENKIQVMASEALRVLAVAYSDLPRGQADFSGNNLVLLGLVGMIDPPRPEVPHALELSRRAGIRTMMITGDHRLTAAAVAGELGMLSGPDQVLTGPELDVMNEAELEQRVESIRVFARVSPKHKLRVVRALKKRGHVVAMTGDGVNDAPAVKEADIGVAMGVNGTDVTREASSLVLADDNFATIVAAVEEGRAIYDNIRRFIRYLLTCNLGEVVTMLVPVILGWPLPLVPIQILWVNLVTDGFPAIALGLEKPEPGVMNRQPRDPREGVFSRGLGGMIVTRGLWIGLGTLLVFWIGLRFAGDLAQARSMAFLALVLFQLVEVFHCRNEVGSAYRVPFLSNPWLLVAVASSLAGILVTFYVAPLQAVFKTVVIDPRQLTLILAIVCARTVFEGACHVFDFLRHRVLVARLR